MLRVVVFVLQNQCSIDMDYFYYLDDIHYLDADDADDTEDVDPRWFRSAFLASAVDFVWWFVLWFVVAAIWNCSIAYGCESIDCNTYGPDYCIIHDCNNQHHCKTDAIQCCSS